MSDANVDHRSETEFGLQNMIGRSQVMQRVYDRTLRAAGSNATVLITGESGTGKELIAEAIHKNSRRSGKPFLAINMAAVPETLVESELFGHVKGSYTGAQCDRVGRFEAAHGGTIFIDEIGDLGLPSQAKLLRVLETHCVTPVGGNEERRIDVRVVAATSRNLEKLIAEGDFREDLYYRLNVVSVHLPPLRQRGDDIALLVRRFVDQLCEANGRDSMKVDDELMDFLVRYEWPGNVRQLRNCVESMVVMSRGDRLTLDNVPPTVRSARRLAAHRGDGLQIPHGITLASLEKAAVVQTLDRFDDNRSQAADALGISVRTLQRKLKQWSHEKTDDSERSFTAAGA